jgi:5-hydroxyisourate hydrolase-like protein (transthyretin family)
MKPATTLKGRVTDPDGKPVAGAQVWPNVISVRPLEGICSARTDADGRYAITDMTAWGPDGNVGCYFNVLHPDFGREMPMYRSIPDTIDVVLQPAGVVAGRVVDRVTGKPAAGVVVSMQGTKVNNHGSWNQIVTAADGSYRIASVKAGQYNVFADAPNRACAALDSIAVEAGKTFAAPDLSLVEGSWLEGQLVDALTGKPMVFEAKDLKPSVYLYCPSRPKSGAACQFCSVDNQGRFRLHVAPGINYPYVANSEFRERTQRGDYYLEKGVEVKASEIVSIEFRILPIKPIPDPEPSTFRYAIPVEAERDAAATIRRLGGWYKVDAENHVVEVNMVHHETAEKRRYDNWITNTDEALRSVGSFPRLKELYLRNGQATDEGLKALTKLRDLEVLFVWDAGKITDAGIAHLAGLKKLNHLHFSNGNLGGDSLAVFSQLPAIKKLSLQENSIDDDALKSLAGIKGLRTLWVGRSKRLITDAGARHLANLTSLEELEMQGSDLTDAGVIALKELKQLRHLYLSSRSRAITDASIDSLLNKTKLTSLWMIDSKLTDKGVERLLALKELKDLTLGVSAYSPEREAELKMQRPGLRLYP